MCVGETVFGISVEDRYRYCSEACLTADYRVHQHEVATLARLTAASGKDVVEPMKLIVRAAARRQCDKTPAASDVLLDLEAAKSFKDEEALQVVSKAATRLAIMCKVGNLELSIDEATHLLLAVQCNAHHILSPADGSTEAFALAIFPRTSMINHSCRPNCAHSFLLRAGKPPQLVMRTIRDVAEGEELVYSYVPLYASTSTRRQILQRCYSFTCHCQRCVTESEDDACLDVVPQTIKHLLDAIAADTLALTLARGEVKKEEGVIADATAGEGVSKLLEAVTKALHLGAPAAHRSIFQAYVCLLKSSKHSSSRTELAAIAALAVVAVGCMNRFCRAMGDNHSAEGCSIYRALDALLGRFLLLFEAGEAEQEAPGSPLSITTPVKWHLGCILVNTLMPTLPSGPLELAAFALEEGEYAEVHLPLSNPNAAASLLRDILSAQNTDKMLF